MVNGESKLPTTHTPKGKRDDARASLSTIFPLLCRLYSIQNNYKAESGYRKMSEEVISRAIGNLGFDYEEAILEAIDDAFEAADNTASVKVWFFEKHKRYSCIVGDKSGGANYAEIFNLQSGNRYADRYNSVQEINEKTGLFNAGSFSYLNISNEVYFFTKYKGVWKSVFIIKDKATGDYKKSIIDNNPAQIIRDMEFEIDFEEFDSILYIKDFNQSNNQSVKDFKVKEGFRVFPFIIN